MKTTTGRIPVADMRGCDLQTGRVSREFAENLMAGLCSTGFVAVVNSGVDSGVLSDAYTASERFFRKDPAFKAAYARADTDGQRGFVAGETAAGRKMKDNKEFFHWGFRDNQPPSEEFGTSMDSLFSELGKLQECLLRAIEMRLGCRENRLVRSAERGDNLLRALYYPLPDERHATGEWASAHTDIDLLSIIPRSTAPGLEIMAESGEWLRVVDLPEGAVVVNAGDMLQSLSNGIVRSSVHRVVCSEELPTERFSMVYFVHASCADSVGPLQECLEKTGNRPRFKEQTKVEMLAGRLQQLGLQDRAKANDAGTTYRSKM